MAALRFEQSILRHAQALRDAKYNPNQPRVPAGNPDGGQWTDDAGAGEQWTSASDGVDGVDGVAVSIFQDPAGSLSPGLILSDANPDPLIEGAQYAQAQATIDYSNALTGISTIDDTTKELSRTLGRTMETMDFIPTWTPQLYGTGVHVAFGVLVRLQGLPGIGPNDVEHSFIDGDTADYYGQPGSIRCPT